MNRADDRRQSATSAFPRVLGRYHLLEELSENAIGVLHLARLEGPQGFQKWSAVRRVHPHLAADPVFVRDFYDAARAAAAIRHPNVEATLDVGETDGTLWVALEYLHGERVAHLVSRAEIAETGVAWDVACRIVGQAALGIDAIHSAQEARGERAESMVGGLTPRRIFVGYEGETKVLEACVPRGVASTLSSDVLPYMAPELVWGETSDRTADVFALGIVLWEMCAGRRLFLGDDDDQTRALIEKHRVPRLETKVRGLPPSVDEIIALALAVEPRHRYPTAADLAYAIDEALVGESLVVTDYDAGRYMKALFADRFAMREDRLRRAADATEIFTRSSLPPSSIPPPQSKAAPKAGRASIPPLAPPPRKKSIPDAPATVRDVHEMPTVEGLSMQAIASMSDSNENPTSIMSDKERRALVDEANPTKATTDENETAIHRGARAPSLEFIDEQQQTEVVPPEHRTVHLDLDPDEDEEEPPQQFYRTGENTTNVGPAPIPAAAPPPSVVRRENERMRPRLDSFDERMDRVPTVEINATPPPMSAVEAAALAPQGFPQPHPSDGMLRLVPTSHPPPMMGREPPPIAAQTFMIEPQKSSELQTVVWLFVLVLGVCCATFIYTTWAHSTATPVQVEAVPPATATTPVATTTASASPTATTINARDLPTATTGVVPSHATHPAGGSHQVSHSTSGGGHHSATTAATSTPTSAPTSDTPPAQTSSSAGTGFLTVICTPACDDVLDGSSSLGPSPVFKAQVKSGTHKITLKTSDPPVTKVVSVAVPIDDTTVLKQQMGE